MSTAIVYASTHHGNTKMLIDAIAAKFDVTLIDATKETAKDLSSYDLIGFASGVYFFKFHRSVMDFASANLPEGKKTFLICTYGGSEAHSSMEHIIQNKKSTVIGKYDCKDYDTFGPFKLVGGVAKGHPTDQEIAGAVEFYSSLMK